MNIPEKWQKFLGKLLGNGGPQIRPMRQEDVDEVVRIIRLHDSDDGKAAAQFYARGRTFDAPYEQDQHFVLIDPEEGRIVGVSGYGLDDSPETSGIFWLGWTYVNPYFRGKGYGARLLHVVIEHVRRLGGRKLYLDTSSSEKYATAVAFYERFGFREEGRLVDYYREGEHKLLMGLKF